MLKPSQTKLISSFEISKHLGIAHATTLRMMKNGEFGSVINLSGCGKRTHLRVRRSDFESWLARHNSLHKSN